MYESLENRSIECKFCGFTGEFKYEWTKGSFIVMCPSCGKVNYEVSRGEIDALAQKIVKESLGDLNKSKNWQA